MPLSGPASVDADLMVRLPKQQRSRRAWNRVLDAGVAILEDGGFEAFTIAEICSRAKVAPPAIYARTTSKEALFLAVYEHGIERLREDQARLTGPDFIAAGSPTSLVRELVTATVRLLLRHRRFLGSVVLISASHAEIRRRGSGYSQELGDQFAAALRPVGDHFAHADFEAAIRSCFNVVFATTIFRIAFGPDFATVNSAGDNAFIDDMCDVATRYLLPAHPTR